MAGLLDLPHDVLANIYDWLRLIEGAVGQSDPPPIEHLLGPPRTHAFNSRALERYTQAYLYHTVHLRSCAAFVRFATTVARAPALGGMVRALEFGAEHAWDAPSQPSARALAASARMWRSLTRLRTAKIGCMEVAVAGFLAAVSQGVRLPALEALTIQSELEVAGWEGPYDLARWQQVLTAAPALQRLRLSVAGRNTWETRFRLDQALPARSPATGPARRLRTSVRTLEVVYFRASHEPALARFVNAFIQLERLDVTSHVHGGHPQVLFWLALPALRTLRHSWVAGAGSAPTPLAALDLRNLSALEGVDCQLGWCTPDFQFLLPPSVSNLVLGPASRVPLDALLALIAPGTPLHHPAIRHLRLDLPFAHDFGAAIDDMTLA